MNGSLFLAPQTPGSEFKDLATLKKCLTDTGLMTALNTGNDANSYLCGENFAQLITFMGCSPHLVFEQPEDGSENYCHIVIHHFESIQLLTGEQTAPPRCPHCRYRIADWRSMLDNWHEDAASQSWHCPKCETDSSPSELDWRQTGGAGSLFVEIKNIFPGEAVPVDQLMAKLQEISGEKWRYFYLV